MRTRAIICCLFFLSACGAAADELSDRVCPILEKVAEGGQDKASYAVQADLVMEVAGAYDFKPEPLKSVLADIDAATIKACPEARTAVLKQVELATLKEAMR